MSHPSKLSPRAVPLPRSPLTRAIHSGQDADADGPLLPLHLPVAPDISVSTTFRSPPPPDLVAVQRRLGERPCLDRLPSSPGPRSHASPRPEHLLERQDHLHLYKRYSHPTLAQTEKVLGSVLNGQALVYSSGLSAAFAALMVTSPDVIAIRGGYHGCHDTIKRYCQLRGTNSRNAVEVRVVDLDDTYPPSGTGLRVLVWLETPVNPTGECRDIRAYATKVRACAPGSELLVDSTLAPPPLSAPLTWSDMTIYSGSKYFGGHSDVLCGVLVVPNSNPARWNQLWRDRSRLGMVPGSLESWLLLRSTKTLQIRVIHQSDTATRLAVWLNSLTERDYLSDSDPDEKRRLVTRVWHSSFQDGGCWIGFDPKTNEPRQMMGGGSPCFAFALERPIYAKWLPHCTKIFIPATSLGGVESLIQHQAQVDPNADARIVRLSIGLEDFNDLRNDLIYAFDQVIKYDQHHSKL